MPKFHVEVPHGSSKQACLEAVHAFLHAGSHFMVNSDWGCEDNVHKAWVIVEAENKDEVRLMVPPAYRANAEITLLSKYDLNVIDRMIERHTS